MISLTLAKCDRSVRKTLTFTACASEPPAASATALRFSNTRRISASMSPVDQLHGGRVERDLAGQVDGVADAHRLRIGADGLRRALGVDDLAAHRALLVSGLDPHRRWSSPSRRSHRRSRARSRAWAAMVRVTRVTSGMRRMTRTSARQMLPVAHAQLERQHRRCRCPARRSTTWSMLVSVLAMAAATAASTPVRFADVRRGSRS